jgi:hypothetical protein
LFELNLLSLEITIGELEFSSFTQEQVQNRRLEILDFIETCGISSDFFFPLLVAVFIPHSSSAVALREMVALSVPRSAMGVLLAVLSAHCVLGNSIPERVYL